jgi:hypothetical protein
MMRNTCLAVFLGAVLVGAACAGCDSESSKKYNVDIFWQIAGADVCTANPGVGTVGELTFDKVRISIYESQDSTTTVQTADVDCGDFSYTIEGLSRGNYWVRVDAMAQIEGDDEPLPYYQAAQEINAPSDAELPDGYKFALEVGKATVEVVWDFETAGMCPQHGVVDVVISIDPEDAFIPCEDGSYVIEGVSWQMQTITVSGYAEGAVDGDDPVTEGSYNDGNPFEIKPREYVGDEALIVVMSDL